MKTSFYYLIEVHDGTPYCELVQVTAPSSQQARYLANKKAYMFRGRTKVFSYCDKHGNPVPNKIIAQRYVSKIRSFSHQTLNPLQPHEDYYS